MSYAMAIGAGVSALGAYGNAKAQKGTLGYEAAVAVNNQTVANYQADLAIQNGVVAEQNQQLKTAGMMGDQRAALAANGVDLGTGSATEILATTKSMGERDALTIRDNAARQAWAYKNQAMGYAAEAGADTSSANGINPIMSGATSLINSATSVSGSWYNYNKSKNGVS